MSYIQVLPPYGCVLASRVRVTSWSVFELRCRYVCRTYPNITSIYDGKCWNTPVIIAIISSLIQSHDLNIRCVQTYPYKFGKYTGMFEHIHIFFVNSNKKSKNNLKYNDMFKHTHIILTLCGCVETNWHI